MREQRLYAKKSWEIMNEIYELLKKAQQGDEQAKSQLIEMNMGLVYSVVKRFRSNQAYQDLVQIGCIGLMKAINHFDFSYNVTFSTYAMPIIIGEVKRYFRDEGQLKVSRSIKENALKIAKIKEELNQKLQKEPSYEELKEACCLDTTDFLLAIESTQFCASLDSSVDYDDENAMRLDEKIEAGNSKDIVLELSLKEEILKLEAREQLLLYYRYQKGYNQSQIAEKLHLSQVQISRLESRIYQKLKEKLSG